MSWDFSGGARGDHDQSPEPWQPNHPSPLQRAPALDDVHLQSTPYQEYADATEGINPQYEQPQHTQTRETPREIREGFKKGNVDSSYLQQVEPWSVYTKV